MTFEECFHPFTPDSIRPLLGVSARMSAANRLFYTDFSEEGRNSGYPGARHTDG
jgi:hypothetical protein